MRRSVTASGARAYRLLCYPHSSSTYFTWSSRRHLFYHTTSISLAMSKRKLSTPSSGDDDPSTPPPIVTPSSPTLTSTTPPPPSLPSTWRRTPEESSAFSHPNRLMVVTYNVNSIRTLIRRLQLPSFSAFLSLLSADVLCLQETKVSAYGDLPAELLAPEGFDSFFAFDTVNKGRNGVVTYARHGLTASAREGLGLEVEEAGAEGDITGQEGRLLVTDHTAFLLVNAYFPNGGRGDERIAYKMKFYAQVEAKCRQWVREGREVMVVGDVNTAHEDIDIHNPKIKTTGFLPEERAWLTRILTPPTTPSSPDALPPSTSIPSPDLPPALPLLVDTWRVLHPGVQQFSFWDQKTLARGRNKGWRIDFVLSTPPLHQRVLYCAMHPEMTASDHSPVVVYLKEEVREQAMRGGAEGVKVLGANTAVEGRKWVDKGAEGEGEGQSGEQREGAEEHHWILCGKGGCRSRGEW